MIPSAASAETRCAATAAASAATAEAGCARCITPAVTSSRAP